MDDFTYYEKQSKGYLKMAETEKKTTTTRKKATTTKKTDDKISALEKQNQELQEQLKALMEAMKNQQVTNTKGREVDLNKKYKCYNLTHSILTVSSGRVGNIVQKEKVFNKYGDYKMLRLAEIEDIYNTMPRVIDGGWLYIDNAEVYEYLGVNMNTIYSKKQMDTIVELKTNEDVEIIASLDDELRRQTVNLIADRMVNKESYDYNKLMLLNQKLGIDILKIKEDKEKILKGE